MLGYTNPRDAIFKHCKEDGVAFAAVAIVMLLVYMPNGINEYANSFRNVRALGGEALLPLIPVLVYGFVRTSKDMKAAIDEED